MEFDFQRIDLLSVGEVERTAGALAFLVRAGLEAVAELPSTFLLGRKAFRLATERLPGGHRPLDLLGQELDSGRRERAARAHERLRRSLDAVPTLRLSTPRCLVWSSPVWRPRKRSVPGLCALIDTPSDELALAVTELWASVFLETVLERAPSGLRRLDVAVGITEDRPAARTALLAALARAQSDAETTLPAPGQAPWETPALAFDRSVEFRRAAVRRPILRRAFGTPVLSGATGRSGPGLERQQVSVLIERQAGQLGPVVARDVIGPEEPLVDVGRTGPPVLNLAALGGQLALQLAQLAELGRGVERLSAQVQSRHDWMAEMDLALLPDDGLRTTVEEQLALVSAVTDVALRATLAASRLARTYAALSGRSIAELDLGVRYPLCDLLAHFEQGALRLADGAPLGPERSQAVEAEVEHLAERHLEVYPRFDALARDVLRRAFQLAAEPGRAGIPLERRIEMARVRRDQAAAQFESRLPRLVASRLSQLGAVVSDAGVLRERARRLEVLADAMLRVVALEVDRRLTRLEPGLPEGAVWHCHIDELLAAVDLRGRSLLARVSARSLGEAAHHAALNLAMPRLLAQNHPLSPVSLARVRALDRAPWLLVAPELVSYAGRPFDTLPSLTRSLGMPAIAGGVVPRHGGA